MKGDTPSLAGWVAHVFEHPVTDPAWHWSPEAPAWEYKAEDTVTFIADTFERSGELLAHFTRRTTESGLLVSHQRQLLGLYVRSG